MKSVLDILLGAELPQQQVRQFRHKRLSEQLGEEVVLSLRELGFSRVAEIKRMHDADGEMEIHILLAGLVEPDLKNTELQAKLGAVTPAELAKKLFLPGEITDIAREIEKLSGYRKSTLEELEKK